MHLCDPCSEIVVENVHPIWTQSKRPCKLQYLEKITRIRCVELKHKRCIDAEDLLVFCINAPFVFQFNALSTYYDHLFVLLNIVPKFPEAMFFHWVSIVIVSSVVEGKLYGGEVATPVDFIATTRLHYEYIDRIRRNGNALHAPAMKVDVVTVQVVTDITSAPSPSTERLQLKFWLRHVATRSKRN